MIATNRIARAALAAGFALTLGIGGLAYSANAYAEVTYGTGAITINGVEGNDIEFDGYQIFKANVADSESSTTGKSETNIAWASDEVQDAVEQAIWSADSDYAGTTAQDAAEFIVANITDTDDMTRVAHDSFANTLATELDKLTDPTVVQPGQQATLAEGYWLFVTRDESLGSLEAGTAPIFAVVGGSDVEVTEKTTLPTVKKVVADDAGALEPGNAMDAQVGQLIPYTLTGTIADNVKTYHTYKYDFTDTLTNLEVPGTATDGAFAPSDEAAFSVRIGETPVASGYELSYDTDGAAAMFSIEFADLKAAKDAEGKAIDLYNADGSTKEVVVSYKARLTDKAAQGGAGNDNTVKLTYSNNPHSTTTGESNSDSAKLFTYALQLVKVDRTTEDALAGAKFTIQATGADDDASKNLYVQVDGTLGTDAHEFQTDADGQIGIKGLDAGAYTVHETAAPTGYDTAADFTFQIKPTYNEAEGTLTALENVLTATDSVIAGSADGNTGDNVLTAKADGNDAANASTGTVKVTVGDVQRISMPLTGLSGISFTWIAGALVLALTVGYILFSRKRRNAGR